MIPAPPRLHVMHVPGAVPERDAFVAEVSRQADVCVHEDPDRLGPMSTWLAALRCMAETDTALTWASIVNDDLGLIPGWQQHWERACTYSPSPLLGLTYLGKIGTRALDKGAPYAVGTNMIWGGAVAYHRSIVDDLLDFAERAAATGATKHDDLVPPTWAKHVGIEPALAGRAVFDLPAIRSLLGHNLPNRRPAATIADPGPSWATRPSSVPISRKWWAEQDHLLDQMGLRS